MFGNSGLKSEQAYSRKRKALKVIIALSLRDLKYGTESSMSLAGSQSVTDDVND